MPDIKCPSGLSGKIRGLKIKELDIFSDKKLLRAGTALEAVLRACWLETYDDGHPYSLKENKSLDWDTVLTCDRFFILLQIRIATHGPEYSFRAECQDCSRRFEWELNLNDLPIKPLPEESLLQIIAGENRFPITLPDGKSAFFALQTGREERTFQRKMNSLKKPTASTTVANRIIEIDGLSKVDIPGCIKDQELRLLTEMLDKFDEVDGGVETTIDVECPHCGYEQSIDLPFGEGFWLPRARARG